jgi:hypothetical protein
MRAGTQIVESMPRGYAELQSQSSAAASDGDGATGDGAPRPGGALDAFKLLLSRVGCAVDGR